ncbi:MAG: helix-turn-helix domain-containing protein [Eubacteriales bacterium]|nr:helix-turn-helix domain-containing protein [Eubacteriales bacterium]
MECSCKTPSEIASKQSNDFMKEVIAMLPETMKRKEYMNMLKKYPDVLKIKEMCNALGGISTKTGYKLLRENKIESIKVGREYCITKISVVDFLMRKNKTTS